MSYRGSLLKVLPPIEKHVTGIISHFLLSAYSTTRVTWLASQAYQWPGRYYNTNGMVWRRCQSDKNVVLGESNFHAAKKPCEQKTCKSSCQIRDATLTSTLSISNKLAGSLVAKLEMTRNMSMQISIRGLLRCHYGTNTVHQDPRSTPQATFSGSYTPDDTHTYT